METASLGSVTDRPPRRSPLRAFLAPCLALQRLSTRPPDSGMQEVALAALKAVMAPETQARFDAPGSTPIILSRNQEAS